MRDHEHQNLLKALSSGNKSGKELQAQLGISQSSLSRLIQNAQDAIVVLGSARSTRYARLDPLEDIGGEIPIYKVDTTGNVHPEATLFTLSQNQFAWKGTNDKTAQLLTTLPYWIQSMWPEGFMGRAFAHQYAIGLKLPLKLQEWTDRHMLRAISLRGEDLPGNVIIGRESALRYFTLARSQAKDSTIKKLIISRNKRDKCFVILAEKALAGEPTGSSAGGEQPKFTAAINDEGITKRVLVKFAKAGTEEGTRWTDLLVCEHIAAGVMWDAGIGETDIEAAETEIIQSNTWTFLQSTRYDRVGLWGRLAQVSLGTVDAEFVGAMVNWNTTVEALHSKHMIGSDDFEKVHWLSAFGEFIGNTDKHLGNISLIPGKTMKNFDLAPAYDMSPMHYRPKSGGILPSSVIEPKAFGAPVNIEENALECAMKFWNLVAQDERISERFRSICSDNIEALEFLSSRPRMIL